MRERRGRREDERERGRERDRLITGLIGGKVLEAGLRRQHTIEEVHEIVAPGAAGVLVPGCAGTEALPLASSPMRASIHRPSLSLPACLSRLRFCRCVRVCRETGDDGAKTMALKAMAESLLLEPSALQPPARKARGCHGAIGSPPRLRASPSSSALGSAACRGGGTSARARCAGRGSDDLLGLGGPRDSFWAKQGWARCATPTGRGPLQQRSCRAQQRPGSGLWMLRIEETSLSLSSRGEASARSRASRINRSPRNRCGVAYIILSRIVNGYHL